VMNTATVIEVTAAGVEDHIVRKQSFATNDGVNAINNGQLDRNLARFFTAESKQVVELRTQRQNGQRLRAGIEICLDHRNGCLRNWLRRQPQPAPLDLQLIVACGMDLIPANGVCTPGGYVLRCNGNIANADRPQNSGDGQIRSDVYQRRRIQSLDFYHRFSDAEAWFWWLDIPDACQRPSRVPGTTDRVVFFKALPL
jgi:hypothetical protein